MAVLVPTFPPPFPDNRKSLRFYATDTATANFGDMEYVFVRVDPVDPAIPEQAWSGSIRVTSITGDLEISFDGVEVQGFIPAEEFREYFGRYEGGIAIRGTGVFHIEAW